MSSITNGNDYKRGWEDGHKAAIDGNDKNYIRMGMSWKFVFHGNTALDSYTDGYNKGYEAGINEKNVVRKVELTNNSDMNINNVANVQNLAREWDALRNLYHFLVDNCCTRIRQVNGQIKGYMTIMADTGVPVEECQEFADKYYALDEANFKELFKRVIDYDLPRIRKYIDLTRRQFIAASGMAPNIELRNPDFNVPPTPPRGAQERKGGSQDLEVRIEAICDLMDFLVEQRDQLKDTIRKYEFYCNDMINSGVPKQVVNDYIPNCAQPNVALINKTSAHIQEQDYPQLMKLYRETATSLMELNLSVNRAPKNM